MAKAKKTTYQGTKRVIGYIRVSTDDQAGSGAGLEAQRRAIMAECERNGWELLRIAEDAGISGKTLNRPALAEALQTLAKGSADMLMAAKLDRLSRSTRDVCELGDMAQRYGWDLSLLDARIDTSTPHGRAQLSMMATFAQLERELIGVRTREALKVKKSQGVILGRPVTLAGDVADTIAQLRAEGQSLRLIADTLNARGIGTAQGGQRWYASTVAKVADRCGRTVAV